MQIVLTNEHPNVIINSTKELKRKRNFPKVKTSENKISNLK